MYENKTKSYSSKVLPSSISGNKNKLINSPQDSLFKAGFTSPFAIPKPV